jgi:TRAP-type C4-dicarboxylate transport system permease large subunit
MAAHDAVESMPIFRGIRSLPYLVGLFALLFLLIVVPDITMFLPQVMGFVR